MPFMGPLVRLFQAIQVTRDEPGVPKSGKSVSAQIVERVQDPGHYPPPLIFPEGTTGNGLCLMKFKSGAFLAGAPVQPILLKFPCCCFSPAWTTSSLPVVLLRMLCQVYNRVQVEVL